MSIELKQAAQQALEALIEASGCVTNSTFVKVMMARDSLVEAISHQHATPEPVVARNPFASRCYALNESHLSGHRLIVGFEKMEDAQDAHEWLARQGRGDFTHPAPSVPADVVRDAIASVREHYRGTDWGKAAECVCDAIDATMLAAKDAK